MKVISMPYLENTDLIETAMIDYKCIIDSFDLGICIVDTFGVIRHVNESYCKVFRTTKSNCAGKKITSIVRDELLLKTLRTKSKNEGRLDYFVGSSMIYSKSIPLFTSGAFVGVMSTYEVEKEDSNITTLSYETARLQNPFSDILIGSDEGFVKELLTAKKAAKSSATILIRGESGTGKELVAKAIHSSSKRKQGPFVAVNCGAIPENLIESELFGHVQGAFTGAIKNKIGKFEQADGGTLFLDEIGDLPLDLQVKLLRVIQERVVERVGSSESTPIDVRIIAATHRDLENMIAEGSFREDLYYRLNVIPVNLPSLKERRGDIAELITYIVDKQKNALGLDQFEMGDDAIELLKSYNWPGNIRELENVMERMMILSSDGICTYHDVPSHISGIYKMDKASTGGLGTSLINVFGGEILTMEEYEKEIIKLALDKYKSFNMAGKALGITHKTVASKARKFGISE